MAQPARPRQAADPPRPAPSPAPAAGVPSGPPVLHGRRGHSRRETVPPGERRMSMSRRVRCVRGAGGGLRAGSQAQCSPGRLRQAPAHARAPRAGRAPTTAWRRAGRPPGGLRYRAGRSPVADVRSGVRVDDARSARTLRRVVQLAPGAPTPRSRGSSPDRPPSPGSPRARRSPRAPAMPAAVVLRAPCPLRTHHGIPR
jgi:hypothetical protein